MQEFQVTASGATHSIGQPFHVFATQNPIEQEGTYASRSANGPIYVYARRWLSK